MSQAKAKKMAKFTGGVLLALLIVNTVAKRVPAVAQVKSTVENGL